MERTFGRAKAPLSGTVFVPGDKSLSHRAVIFSAMAEGVSKVSGVLDSADVRSSIAVVSGLGASVALNAADDGSLEGEIAGWGDRGPTAAGVPLDCGNSGTTVRLMMGVLAGWPVSATLTGDESLSGRPMRRVTDPLSRMGARFETSAEGTLPVTVHGTASLAPIDYVSPVASAQVKSAILLAGTRAHGTTRVTEPALSRDHTERLLPAYGVRVETLDTDHPSASVAGPAAMSATDVDVPRDPSSAAFMVCAGLLVPGSAIRLPGVSLNPSRIGFLRVLQRMGARVSVADESSAGTEPLGTLVVEWTGSLAATLVEPDEIPSLVDEVPVLAVLATAARGTTRFEGVEELRVKESDRLEAVRAGLSALGATVRAGADWLEVDGCAELGGATLDSLGDHRLAMCWALAGLVASEPVTVTRFDAVDVSYPRFADDLVALGA